MVFHYINILPENKPKNAEPSVPADVRDSKNQRSTKRC